MTRNDPHHYLAIPRDYCQWLGGLRWCASGEAVEHVASVPSIGCTFAMAGEIALFVEGYSAGGPLICFGFVLHLLHLLGLGVRDPERRERGERFADLADALRESGRPIRNAGALCAMLCRGVPHSAVAPDPADLGMSLRYPAAIAFFRHRTQRPAEEPPLEPAEFEAQVREVLEGLTPGDVRHWLRHGRGPIVGAGEAVERAWSRDFGAVLTGLGRRPRLAAALPLVERLSGALALPPRRLAHAELPSGGYADITTRGLPEQLLPTQFALDEIEFLRRFAERELLYFHREEPRTPAAEELVFVLDQGVRTWGDVRLVLAAAALAQVRRAARQGTPYRITTTGAIGRILESDEVDPDSLGDLLEASDLSPHPGAALGPVLDDPAARPRDIVLLTHPRSLREPEVVDAARRVAPGTRLFAIAVDGNGDVALAELRHGAPVALGRCRVEVGTPGAPEPPKVPAAPINAACWRGDVEPIGFPFLLGVQGSSDGRFDFDEAGDRLLAAGHPHGALQCWRVDGTEAEMIPRAMVDGKVVSWVHKVLGVAGGFVVSGWNGTSFVAAHYDFTARTCTAHVVDARPNPVSWSYVGHLHTIVARDADGRYLTLDLGVDKEESASSRRAVGAFFHASDRAFQPSPAIVPPNASLPPAGRGVCLQPKSGTIEVQFAPSQRLSCKPRSDGEPMLEGGRIVQAQSGGNVIATLVRTERHSILILFANQDNSPIDVLSFPSGVSSFALSRDGRRLAYRVGDRQLEVRDVGGGPIPRLVTPREKSHSTLDVALGATFLTIKVGRHAHLIRWNRGRLALSRNEEGDPSKLVAREVVLGDVTSLVTVPATKGRRKAASFDRRYVAECTSFGLTILVDTFGQIAVCNPDRRPIAMFYVFRSRVAAWLPDGTRLGPLPIVGGPPTPDAAGRIGAALCAAQARARAEGKGRRA